MLWRLVLAASLVTWTAGAMVPVAEALPPACSYLHACDSQLCDLDPDFCKTSNVCIVDGQVDPGPCRMIENVQPPCPTPANVPVPGC